MYLFMDLETTGLSLDSEVLEFAGILTDDKLRIVDVINDYYRCDEVPYGASKVNGLTPAKLNFLSEFDFITGSEELMKFIDREDITLVGHNILAYDFPLLKNALHRVGYDLDSSRYHFRDTLSIAKQTFPGKHNLAATVDYALTKAGMTLDDMNYYFNNIPILQKYNKDKSKQYHSALYDSFATYVAFSVLNGSN